MSVKCLNKSHHTNHKLHQASNGIKICIESLCVIEYSALNVVLLLVAREQENLAEDLRQQMEELKLREEEVH